MANTLNIDTATVNLSFTLGVDDLVYDSSNPDIICNIPVTFTNTVTLEKNIIGTTTTIPLVDFVAHSSTVPLIRSTADVANAIVLRSYDNSSVLNTSLDSAGKFFSRRVSADAYVVTALEQAVGAVTLGFTGPSLFACDASGGTITFTLPAIDVNSPNGYQFTFKKTDVSANSIFVSASGGQSIDGATSVSLAYQWSLLKLVSIVSGGSGYWLIIDTTGTAGPKGDTGTTGSTGTKGDTGTGAKGDTGTAGLQGDTGAAGS